MANRISWLFCEGEQGSPDVLLLRRVVGGLGVRVQPCGSKDGLPAFARGFSRRDANASYLAIRDRDFDAEPSAEPRLLPDPMRREAVWLGHRASVESYLVEPGLLDGWLTATGRPSPGCAALAESLGQAARDIAAHQAARWALAAMRPAGLSLARLHALSGSDGELPQDLPPAACRALAAARLAPIRGTLGALGMDALDQRIEHYTARFEADDFWADQHWLAWFHGKDLRAAWARRVPNIHWRRCLMWAAEHLNWRAHPDLVQLHDLIKDRSS